ncbi:hypothetical protein CP533_2674 [Ophiocordyceps camponoti-saundersi (nom. inval.)]|nr:hypothetical protein CP533_2674 [Ophiocordyceps camponoti-saundersi (nom. inval.)]
MAAEDNAESSKDQEASPSASTEPVNADIGVAVEELLNSLSNKFSGISSEMFAKMDAMSRRLDKLEAAVMQNKASSPKEGGSSSAS